MVLHSFHIVVDDPLVEAEETEKISQELVAAGDAARDGLTSASEDKAAVLFVFEQPVSIETLHHIGNARLGNFQTSRNIDDARVAFGLDKGKDALEVILDGSGIATGVGF